MPAKELKEKLHNKINNLLGTKGRSMKYSVNPGRVDDSAKKEDNEAISINSREDEEKYQKYLEENKDLLHDILWKKLQEAPLSPVEYFHQSLKEEGHLVDISFVAKTFKKWKWSFKKASVKQLQKYKKKNIDYYGTYILVINSSPWLNLKFLGETQLKFKGKYCFKCIINKQIDQIYTLTLMTNLDPKSENHIFINLREESNTTIKNLDCIINFIKHKYLGTGDYLFMDTSNVHFDNVILQKCVIACDNAGVILRIIPKHSPELNPCELIFDKIQQLELHQGSKIFCLEIAKILRTITYTQVLEYYRDCIYRAFD
jgi:hypothetical protein